MSNQLTPERIKELRDMIAGLPNNPWKGIFFNDLLEALDTIEARNARIAELEAALSIKNASYQIDPDEAICNAVRIGQSAHWVSADGTVKSIDPADFYDQPKEPTS